MFALCLDLICKVKYRLYTLISLPPPLNFEGGGGIKKKLYNDIQPLLTANKFLTNILTFSGFGKFRGQETFASL